MPILKTEGKGKRGQTSSWNRVLTTVQNSSQQIPTEYKAAKKLIQSFKIIQKQQKNKQLKDTIENQTPHKPDTPQIRHPEIGLIKQKSDQFPTICNNKLIKKKTTFIKWTSQNAQSVVRDCFCISSCKYCEKKAENIAGDPRTCIAIYRRVR